MFWILTACLFVIASLFVLLPLWLRNKAQSFDSVALRKNENITLFHERSNELENELAVGNLEQSQYEALLAELQQSLLADVSDQEDDGVGKNKTTKSGKNSEVPDKLGILSNAIPIVFALLIPVLAYGLYSQWGYIDDVELMDLFQRTVDNADNPEESQNLIVSLGQAVQADEDQPWAWYFLAENFATLGMFTEADIAYQQSASRMDDTAEKALVLGRVAFAKYILADFKITAEILEVIKQAQEINPNEISIVQLLAADAEERQDYSAAIDYWRLLIQSNPNSQQAQLLRENIAAAQQLLAADGQDIDVGAQVDVNLSLADGIEMEEGLRVFIAARNASREGLPPLAASFVTVGDLPTTIRLDNSSAVGPFNLSSADTIYISALISYSDTATPSSGDYQVVSANFSPNGRHAVIDLVISERLP